jgi:inosine-uridine nucleoside N-ribohydrolase
MKNGIFFLLILLSSCQRSDRVTSHTGLRVLFDTDANNELDDQHALAYLLFNSDYFRVEGVTVNATRSGGNIVEQAKEAERVMRLCKAHGSIPLLKGADASFLRIKDSVHRPVFDGYEAVNFILEASAKPGAEKLILIAVGKLTNVALALMKDPSFADRVRVVWLGSNYPDPGEYNLENDTASLNYVLNSGVPFEMVTVRYGKPSGTAAVSVTKSEIASRMPGKGPRIGEPVEGRHGGMFSTFGDYSVNLFEHIDYHGDPPSRALFDMAAVAIVKNPPWAQSTSIPAPVLLNGQWKERPENARTILVWENFDKESILTDFYHSMDHYRLPDLP